MAVSSAINTTTHTRFKGFCAGLGRMICGSTIPLVLKFAYDHGHYDTRSEEVNVEQRRTLLSDL